MENRLRETRLAKGVSLSELARKSGVCRATLYKIENGNAEARTTRTLQKIAQALGVHVTDIFHF